MGTQKRLAEFRQKLVPIAALLLLCLLWAAETLRLDLFTPDPSGPRLSPIAYESSLLGLFAVLAALVGLIRKTRWAQPRRVAEAMLVGLGLFVLPLLLTGFGKSFVTDSTRVALFSLTPLFAVVFEPFLGGDLAVLQRGGFVAAMVAGAGTMLVFPIDIPNSAASFLAFCGVLASSAAIAAANSLGVRACRQSNDLPLIFAMTAAATASFCLAMLGTIIPKNKANSVPFDAWTALDLFTLGLLFWLMRHMSAVRMTTRFLISPLLANLVGLAILRPHVQLQGGIGLLLIAIASGWILFAPDELPEANRKLLKLD